MDLFDQWPYNMFFKAHIQMFSICVCSIVFGETDGGQTHTHMLVMGKCAHIGSFPGEANSHE